MKPNEKEGKKFLEIVEQFDDKSRSLLGGYNYYDLLGQPPFSEFSNAAFQRWHEYSMNEIKDKTLKSTALNCLTTAVKVLENPESKKNYDNILRKSTEEEIIKLIRTAAADKTLHHNEKDSIIRFGLDKGFTREQVDKIIQTQKSRIRFQDGVAGPDSETRPVSSRSRSVKFSFISGLIGAAIAASSLIVLVVKRNFEGWQLFGLLISLTVTIWGGFHLYREYREYYQLKSGDRHFKLLPGIKSYLALGIGMISLMLIKLLVFGIMVLVFLSFVIAYLILKYARSVNKYYVLGVPVILYSLFFGAIILFKGSTEAPVTTNKDQLTISIDASHENEIISQGPGLHNAEGYVQESSSPVNPNLNTMVSFKPNQAADLISEASHLHGTRVKNSLLARSENQRKIKNLYSYLGKGDFEKLHDLTSENSRLELLLYETRFCSSYRWLLKRNYFYHFKPAEILEYYVNDTLSYCFVDFELIEPKERKPSYLNSRVELSSSLSPWIVQRGNSVYRDSIPIINGEIEFNYGKDSGMLSLHEACPAEIMTDWLRVRSEPSTQAEIIGRLKGATAGDGNETSKIKDLALSDYYRKILIDSATEENGYVFSYVICMKTGQYETGYLAKEYLEISNNLN